MEANSQDLPLAFLGEASIRKEAESGTSPLQHLGYLIPQNCNKLPTLE
jgi:hypothetical protein